MANIEYSKSPNVDTAFVVRDDGKKNRTLLVAPQDTSTLEYPENPNSTKGYVTVGGKKHRVVMVADVLGGGGGGGVDESKVIVKSSTIPTADADSYRKMYIYAGETDATYTHGYIYECQKTSITYTGTVSFEAATLSGTTVTCSGDDFAAFLTEAGADPTPIVSGTMTYDTAGGGWRLVGKDAEDNTVTTIFEYNEDYADFGFVFTGTPVDGDVIAFTCTVAEDTVTYGWVRLDVQPDAVTSVNGQTGAVTLGINDVAPTQTGFSGYVLGTDGSVAGWVKPEQVQRSVLPQASEEEVGKIYQYIGATDGTYTNAYFYKCVSDGQVPATYSWVRVDAQPAGAQINDNSTSSLTETWSANKLNTMIGDVETLLAQI